MKKREFIYLVLIVLLAAALAALRPRTAMSIETRVDTVFVRDTLRDTVLIVRERYRIRTDTAWLRLASDTVFVEVEVPVERKIYQTDDYRAVVEGFRPSLAGIEIYRTTVYVDRETIVRPPVPRWGIGIQAGYGYNFDRLRPYIGIGIQYNIITW